MSLTLYYFPTPNGRKVSIALEEMELDYQLELVNIFNREAQHPDYLKICPNGRIPALVDHSVEGSPISIFESGAILLYLGRKSGRFYPAAERERSLVEAWLFWQMAGLGPMTGQVTWFMRAAQKPGRAEAETSLAIHRFTREMRRLYQVLDHQLANQPYISGTYSIADMACWPWVDQHHDYLGDLGHFPHLHRWHQQIAQRPAVKRALQLCLHEARQLIAPDSDTP